MRETFSEPKHDLTERDIKRKLKGMLIRSKAAVGIGDDITLETLRRDPHDTSCTVDAGELAVNGQVGFPAPDESHRIWCKHSFEFRWESDDVLQVTITDHANAL